MSLLHKYWKTSLFLGSASLLGLAAFGTLQVNPAVGASTNTTSSGIMAQLQGNPPANPLLSQGQGPGMGQGQGPGMSQGQGPGMGQGTGNCPGMGQGQGMGRGAHLEDAAAQLGVSEDALRDALGIPDQPPQRPDLATAAAELGTTEDELRQTMHNFMQTQRQARQGQGPQAGPPDFTAIAQQYGVSEAEFRRIMGIPDRPDLAAAAAQLGVTEEALQEALRSAHGGRGPGSGPGGPGGNHGGHGSMGGPGGGPGSTPGNASGGSI